MKKLIISSIVAILLAGCTSSEIARHYGGTKNVDLPKGYKLVEVTWKDGGELWYLLEPMEEDYQPKTKVFQEDSQFGVIEGKVVFKESR